MEYQSKPLKIIAVSAGKGGVGKSNIAINLSLALAQKGKKVLLLDADLALGNLAILLGLQAKFNLSHVIQGICSLHEIMLVGPYGIRLVPAASGVDSMTHLSLIELAGIVDAFNELTEDFDYMIIDTAAGISDTVLSFIRSTQEVLIVVCNEPTSLTDTYGLLKVLSQHSLQLNFHVVVNMVRDAREGRYLFNKLFRLAEEFLDLHLNYMLSIPFDEHVHEAVKRQKAVLDLFPHSISSKSFKKLAELLDKWPLNPAVGGNTSFFIERLVLGKSQRPEL